MKILNLYCGIGGNRRLWGEEHSITAIENNPKIAKIYQDFFPNDKVIVADAHQYLLEHFKELFKKSFMNKTVAFCTNNKKVIRIIIKMVTVFMMSVYLTIFFTTQFTLRIFDKFFIDTITSIFSMFIIWMIFTAQTNRP